MVAFAFIMVMWIFHAIFYWIYQGILYNPATYQRLMEIYRWNYTSNDMWYGVTLAYGLFVAFPCFIYLMKLYLYKAQEIYRGKQQTTQEIEPINRSNQETNRHLPSQ